MVHFQKNKLSKNDNNSNSQGTVGANGDGSRYASKNRRNSRHLNNVSKGHHMDAINDQAIINFDQVRKTL